MNTFLLAAGVFVLATVALGLARILYGPGDADRIMAAQLLGTGGVSALLLYGAVRLNNSLLDVALTLMLLAAFASVIFYKSAVDEADGAGDDRDHGG